MPAGRRISSSWDSRCADFEHGPRPKFHEFNLHQSPAPCVVLQSGAPANTIGVPSFLPSRQDEGKGKGKGKDSGDRVNGTAPPPAGNTLDRCRRGEMLRVV